MRKTGVAILTQSTRKRGKGVTNLVLSAIRDGGETELIDSLDIRHGSLSVGAYNQKFKAGALEELEILGPRDKKITEGQYLEAKLIIGSVRTGAGAWKEQLSNAIGVLYPKGAGAPPSRDLLFATYGNTRPDAENMNAVGLSILGTSPISTSRRGVANALISLFRDRVALDAAS
jgi:hypothetical protein